jgi:hypothetical protein
MLEESKALVLVAVVVVVEEVVVEGSARMRLSCCWRSRMANKSDS